jgi:hypothetical protein
VRWRRGGEVGGGGEGWEHALFDHSFFDTSDGAEAAIYSEGGRTRLMDEDG